MQPGIQNGTTEAIQGRSLHSQQQQSVAPGRSAAWSARHASIEQLASRQRNETTLSDLLIRAALAPPLSKSTRATTPGRCAYNGTQARLRMRMRILLLLSCGASHTISSVCSLHQEKASCLSHEPWELTYCFRHAGQHIVYIWSREET